MDSQATLRRSGIPIRRKVFIKSPDGYSEPVLIDFGVGGQEGSLLRLKLRIRQYTLFLKRGQFGELVRNAERLSGGRMRWWQSGSYLFRQVAKFSL